MAVLTRQPLATLHREFLQSHTSLLISKNTTFNGPSKRKAPTDENIDPTLSKKLQTISDSYLASFLPPSTSPRFAERSQTEPQTPAAKQACISSSPTAPASRSRKHATLPKRRTRSIPLKPLLFSLEEVLGATFPSYTDGNSAPTCGYGGLTVELREPRSLLVELNITDYYAPGYDYLSFVIVPGDEDDNIIEKIQGGQVAAGTF
ncbi:hypothetical protein NUW58_g7424 [Xylaria curta]|uniref:Uncharacterized protein n=1 Tax=Xylaria curta TaxID=42375 RepID=A0ACC1NK06_9PEZI|nr:hypothetical protein NUW58_g7424 [Xylaria curta]